MKKLLKDVAYDCAHEMLEKLEKKLQIKFSDEGKTQCANKIAEVLNNEFALETVGVIDWDHLDVEKYLKLEREDNTLIDFPQDDYGDVFARQCVPYRTYILSFSYGKIQIKSGLKRFYMTDNGTWHYWSGKVFFDKKTARDKKGLPRDLKERIKNILLTKNQGLMDELADIYVYNDFLIQ